MTVKIQAAKPIAGGVADQADTWLGTRGYPASATTTPDVRD